jgi:hypothetical protein
VTPCPTEQRSREHGGLELSEIPAAGLAGTTPGVRPQRHFSRFRLLSAVVKPTQVVHVPFHPLPSHHAAHVLGVGALAAVLVGGCSTEPAPPTTATRTSAPSVSTPAGTSSSAAAQKSAQSATAQFPPDEVAKFRAIVDDTLTIVNSGDQTRAAARITDLETLWDADQSSLQPLDETGWTTLDKQIDSALKAVRTTAPNLKDETQALTTLQTTLQS